MSLKAMVNTRESWDEFCDYLDSKIAEQHRSLESVTDPVVIYKTQGQILALRKLKHLRAELNGSN
jgi:hypothetical protein